MADVTHLVDSADCTTVGCPNEADAPDGLCRLCRTVPSRRTLLNPTPGSLAHLIDQEDTNVPTTATCKIDGCDNPSAGKGGWCVGLCQTHISEEGSRRQRLRHERARASSAKTPASVKAPTLPAPRPDAAPAGTPTPAATGVAEAGNPSRERVYLAGPMRGLPDYNFPAFHEAAEHLRDIGFDVWSPAEQDIARDGFNPETGEGLRSFRDYMRRDLPAVLDSDTVVVLPGWHQSQGARLEVRVAYACGIPVLRYPDLQPARHPTSARFHERLERLALVHDRKSADYGSDADPLANVRSSERLGIPAWIGVENRIGDKNQRVESFVRKGSLANEPLEDAIEDRAVYSVIQLVLLDEARDASEELAA